jgi:hypothetical protein
MSSNKLKYLVILFTALIVTGPILANWYSVVRHDPTQIGPLSILQVIRGVFFVILLTILSKYVQKSVRINPLLRPLLIMSLFLFILMPFHQTPIENAVYIFQILYVGIFIIGGFVIGVYKTNADEWLINVARITLVVIISLQIYGYTQGSRFYSDYALVGLGDRPSVTAAAVAALIPIFLLRLEKMNLFDWIVLFLSILSLTMTMRRTEILAVLICFIGVAFVTIYHNSIFNKGKITRVFIIFIIMIGIGYLIASSPLADDFQHRIEGMVISEGGTGSGRLILWPIIIESGINRSEGKLIFGEGVGSSSNYIHRELGSATGSHNIWLDTFISSGVIGILIMIWFHLHLIKLFNKVTNKYSPAIVSVILILIIYGIFQGGIFSPIFIPIYTLKGVSMGMNVQRFRC